MLVLLSLSVARFLRDELLILIVAERECQTQELSLVTLPVCYSRDLAQAVFVIACSSCGLVVPPADREGTDGRELPRSSISAPDGCFSGFSSFSTGVENTVENRAKLNVLAQKRRFYDGFDKAKVFEWPILRALSCVVLRNYRNTGLSLRRKSKLFQFFKP